MRRGISEDLRIAVGRYERSLDEAKRAGRRTEERPRIPEQDREFPLSSSSQAPMYHDRWSNRANEPCRTGPSGSCNASYSSGRGEQFDRHDQRFDQRYIDEHQWRRSTEEGRRVHNEPWQRDYGVQRDSGHGWSDRRRDELDHRPYYDAFHGQQQTAGDVQPSSSAPSSRQPGLPADVQRRLDVIENTIIPHVEHIAEGAADSNTELETELNAMERRIVQLERRM